MIYPEKKPKKGREERRQNWIDILKGCAHHHQMKSKELESPIIGAEESEECIMHKVWNYAIIDCIGLIEMLPMTEKKEEDDDDEGLPQHSAGPLG